MDYDAFFARTSLGMRFGLERMEELAPEQTFAAVHIAGTNGKGSVATKIAAVLQENGYKTGLYTSPHLETFHERIRIDGQMISEEEVERLLPPLMKRCEEATFFELTTALAFHYFAEQQVDIAVVEAGLGGRLDATNVIMPILAVITSIGLDHTELLGPTREDIAREKGGIAKPGVPLVLGPTALGLGLEADIAVEGPFADFLEENRAIAKAALEAMPGFAIETMEELDQLPMGRFQEVAPGVIYDVAHNPDGVRALLAAIERRYPGRPIRMSIAISNDKDIGAFLDEIRGKIYALDLIESDHPRLTRVDQLREMAEGLPLDVERRRPDELHLICGSCFLRPEGAF